MGGKTGLPSAGIVVVVVLDGRRGVEGRVGRNSAASSEVDFPLE